MYRRGYVLMIAIAAAIGICSLFVHFKYHQPLLDPEGAFLGPSWIRLPLLVGLAIAIDLVPRALWVSRLRPSAVGPVVRERWRRHWTRERIVLVASGIISFYIVYVSYRNLKSALPYVRPHKTFDYELRLVDRVLFFGHDPGPVLHAALGTDYAAHFLSYVYLWFLPLVPIAVTVWLVWSRNISFGYWFVTAQCIAWTLGTISYYDLPTLGPVFEHSSAYTSLSPTPTTALVETLSRSRVKFLHGDYDGHYSAGVINSVAGFASLHCAITLLMALMVQYTLRNVWLKRFFWANFACTVVATIYFGWHYLSDDIAGIMIAFVAFYVGGLATGQRFNRFSLTSHPSTTTSVIPVDRDDEPEPVATPAGVGGAVLGRRGASRRTDTVLRRSRLRVPSRRT